MLTVAFGESTMRRTQVQLRYNQFKEDREDVNARPGRLSTPTIDEKIKALLQRLWGRSAHAKQFLRIVPKLLIFELKHPRMDIA